MEVATWRLKPYNPPYLGFARPTETCILCIWVIYPILTIRSLFRLTVKVGRHNSPVLAARPRRIGDAAQATARAKTVAPQGREKVQDVIQFRGKASRRRKVAGTGRVGRYSSAKALNAVANQRHRPEKHPLFVPLEQTGATHNGEEGDHEEGALDQQPHPQTPVR